jgi:hypothetical protein
LYRRLPLVTDPAARRKLEELLDADRKPPELAIERPGTTRKILDEECDLVIVKAGGEELFRAFVARQPAPAADPRWLRCGALLPSEAAAKLAEIKGLVMEAVFPLPDGGRVEVTTDRLSEAGEKPEDYADPATLRFTRVGSFKPPPADKDKPKLKPKDKGEEKKSQPSAPAP